METNKITKMIIHADAVKEAVYTIGRRKEYNSIMRTLVVLDLLAWKLTRVVTYVREEGSEAKLVNGKFRNIPDVIAKGEVYESILDTINDLKDWHGIDIEEELKDTLILDEPEKLNETIKDLGLHQSSMYPVLVIEALRKKRRLKTPE